MPPPLPEGNRCAIRSPDARGFVMRGVLSFLHLAYFPFVALLGFLQLTLAVLGIVGGCLSQTGDFVLFWAFGIIFVLLFGWYLVPMWFFLTWKPDPTWIMELKVTREEVPLL